MAHILSGKIVQESLIHKLKIKIESLSLKPTLVILQVGARPDSEAYIRQKKLLAEKIGAVVIHQQFPEIISQPELLNEIEKYNNDTKVHGIILQIPLPAHLDKNGLINAIDFKKDVDGLTKKNTELFLQGNPKAFIPATARGVFSLLTYYGIEIKGKKVTVVGKSALVGTPIAELMKIHGAIVTVCDKKTGDLVPFTKPADIIIVAVGKQNLIGKNHVSPGQTIVDVGINEVMINSKRTLVGDVDFKNVEPIVSAISPVPGGVGPMTVISLFENLVQASIH